MLDTGVRVACSTDWGPKNDGGGTDGVRGQHAVADDSAGAGESGKRMAEAAASGGKDAVGAPMRTMLVFVQGCPIRVTP